MVTIFCHSDDFCKFYNKKVEKRLLATNKKRGNRTSKMSLSEVITISIYFHVSGYKTFKSYYTKCICKYHKKDFKHLVSYNRFLELKRDAAFPIALFSSMINSTKCTGVSFIDSFPLKVCDNKRIYAHKTFKGVAQRGVSSMGWFYGFKLHVSINHKGEILGFNVTPGNVHDANEVVINKITKNMFGRLFGDRGYLGKKTFENLWKKGVKIITNVRKNMKKKPLTKEEKQLLRKRGVIESVGNILKNILSINHTRHRSITGFIVNLCSGLLAYAFRSKKPSIDLPKHLLR